MAIYKENLLKIWELALVTSFENQLQAFCPLKSCPGEGDSNKTVLLDTLSRLEWGCHKIDCMNLLETFSVLI